jgi:uncharacterized YigZ family protein
MKEYNTVLKEACSEQVERKSRFICSVRPVNSECEALDFIKKISEKYKDATHNVFAYIVDDKVQIMRASDDGEPQGTAGVPVLEVIKKENLTNVCVIVTRYFGGILLGAAGLIRAYSSAAKAGLLAAQKCRMAIFSKLAVEISYGQMGKLQNSMASMGNNITNIEYTENVKMYIKVKHDKVENTVNTIKEITYGNALVECIENYYDVSEVISIE